MKLFLGILLTLFLLGCKKSTDDNSYSKIAGKWIFVNQTDIISYDKDGYGFPPPPPRENLGLNFYSKDSCESFEIYMEFIDSIKNWKEIRKDNNIKKLGRKTIYFVNKDSLKIFDRSFNKWRSYKIMFLNENNLILNYENVLITNYVRKLNR